MFRKKLLSDNPGVPRCLCMRDSAGKESLGHRERERLTSGIYLSFYVPSEAAITSPTWRAPRLKRFWVRDEVSGFRKRQEKRDAKKLFMAEVGPTRSLAIPRSVCSSVQVHSQPFY